MVEFPEPFTRDQAQEIVREAANASGFAVHYSKHLLQRAHERLRNEVELNDIANALAHCVVVSDPEWCAAERNYTVDVHGKAAGIPLKIPVAIEIGRMGFELVIVTVWPR